MTDSEAVALQRELASLTARVRRLESRLNELEPETARGFPPLDPPQPRQPGGSAVLDLLGDALDAFGSPPR